MGAPRERFGSIGAGEEALGGPTERRKRLLVTQTDFRTLVLICIGLERAIAWLEKEYSEFDILYSRDHSFTSNEGDGA